MAENYCIFSANFFPNVGGVSRYTYNLAKKLQSKGKNVFIVTNNVFGLSTFENADGIKIYRLPCYNFLKGMFPVICYDEEAKGILAILKRIKFKAVIVNNRFHIHSLIGAHLGKACKAKVITVEHGSAYVRVKNPITNFFIRIYEHLITFFIKRYTDEFYGISKESSKWLKRFCIKSKGEMYNSINAEAVESTVASPVKSYKKSLKIKSPIVTYAGNLDQDKGVEKLIEAYKEIKKEIDCSLVITGDGNLKSTLVDRESEGIYFLDRLNYFEVTSLFGESDIFCLPIDYHERVSSGVFEAAAAGAFVITTEGAGAYELIDSEEKGIILKENTVENITAALKKALTDEKYRRSAVKKCKKVIRDVFSLERTVEKIIEVSESDKEDEEI